MRLAEKEDARSRPWVQVWGTHPLHAALPPTTRPTPPFTSLTPTHDQDAAPLFKSASAFYKGVAARAAANGHSIDVFAC